MKMRKQRLMGLALVVIAVLVVLLASTGKTPEEQDATAALLIGPLGLYMMFTKQYVLYDGEPETRARDSPEAPAAPTTSPTRKEGVTTWEESELSRPRASRAGRT